MVQILVLTVLFIIFRVVLWLLRMMFPKLRLYPALWIAILITTIVAGIGIYFYYLKTEGPIDEVALSDFRLEKTIMTRSESPAVTESIPASVREELFVFYSFDITNLDEDFKSLDVGMKVNLRNFNNMGGTKSLFTGSAVPVLAGDQTTFKDLSALPLDPVVSELNPFRRGQTIRIYSYIRLVRSQGGLARQEDEIAWLEQQLPFNPELSFLLSAATASDASVVGKYFLRQIAHQVEPQEFQRTLYNSVTGKIFVHQLDRFSKVLGPFELFLMYQ